MVSRWAASGQDVDGGIASLMERASGKMMLLGKLLPKLRAEGHK